MFTVLHRFSGQDALGNLVFNFMIHPHCLHCVVAETYSGQSLQMFSRSEAIVSSTLPIFLLNRSHGLAGLVLIVLLYVQRC
jgi:hypothetical protein